jgi:hypothetical protein
VFSNLRYNHNDSAMTSSAPSTKKRYVCKTQYLSKEKIPDLKFFKLIENFFM